MIGMSYDFCVTWGLRSLRELWGPLWNGQEPSFPGPFPYQETGKIMTNFPDVWTMK